MNRVFIAIVAAASVATSVLANPVPVTETTKRPYRAGKIYCNDTTVMPPEGENIACYNHDACYSDPRGRSRSQCDAGYLRDMRSAGRGAVGMLKYRALRFWGSASWQRSRRHDLRENQQ